MRFKIKYMYSVPFTMQGSVHLKCTCLHLITITKCIQPHVLILLKIYISTWIFLRYIQYSIVTCIYKYINSNFVSNMFFSRKTHIIPYQYILSSLVCSLIVISPFVTFSGHCCWKKTSPPFIWQQTQSEVRLQ